MVFLIQPWLIFRVRSNLVEFEFQIGLHKDDFVLLFIQEKLGIKVDI